MLDPIRATRILLSNKIHNQGSLRKALVAQLYEYESLNLSDLGDSRHTLTRSRQRLSWISRDLVTRVLDSLDLFHKRIIKKTAAERIETPPLLERHL